MSVDNRCVRPHLWCRLVCCQLPLILLTEKYHVRRKWRRWGREAGRGRVSWGMRIIFSCWGSVSKTPTNMHTTHSHSSCVFSSSFWSMSLCCNFTSTTCLVWMSTWTSLWFAEMLTANMTCWRLGWSLENLNSFLKTFTPLICTKVFIIAATVNISPFQTNVGSRLLETYYLWLCTNVTSSSPR